MPPAQFSRQTIRLQFDKDIHFGDDASITLAKAGGDIIDTITLRVDWPEGIIKNTNPISSNGVSYNLSTLVQYSTGTAMIDRVELLYDGNLIERHYGETMFIQGDITVPECKQAGLSNLVGTHVTSNLVSYYIQFPFSVKLPLCALDESPTLRIVFNPSTYFAFGVQYTGAVNMSLYVDYVYVSKAEREYLQKNRICYPARSFQMASFRIPNTYTLFSCDTHFVNMTKEIFWIIQEDQYTSNIYNYSNDLVTLRLLLDGDEVISDDFGTPQFLTWITKHTRMTSANYYTYSFELYPESSQENGSLNMTAVTNQRHILQLTSSSVWRTLRIYAHAYNIFCVENGRGRTVYTQNESSDYSYRSDLTIPYVFPTPPPEPLYVFNNLFSPLTPFLYYGQAVAINDDGTTAVIGAAGTNQNIGTVVVYRYDGTTWDSGDQLSTALGSNSYFGYSVDVSDDGNSVVVGVPAANGGRGYVSVYMYNGSSWSDVPILSNIADFTYGWSVAINGPGDTVVIGAPRALGFAGYACAFKKIGGVWNSAIEQPLVSTSTNPSAFFGYSVSVSADGNTAVVGAPSGRYAAVYTYSAGVWGSASVLTTSLAASVNFGWSVYMAPLAGAVIVGAPNNEYAAVYRYNGVSWSSTPAVQLVSEAGSGGQFGSAVTLNDDATIAIVGASVAGYAAAYIYNGTSWSSANEIENQTGVQNSRFGSALSLSHDGSSLLIGAYAVNNANGYAALYVQT